MTTAVPERGGFVEHVKTTVILALRAGINEDLPQDDPLRKVINNIDMEYPYEPVQYPGIWVQFSFRDIKALSINEVTFQRGTNPPQQIGMDEHPEGYRLWNFSGTVTITIVALTSLERDRLADAWVKMYAFRQENEFWNHFTTSSRISMSANKDELRPGGQSTSFGTPWQSDQPIYEDNYSFELVGQFATDPQTMELVRISDVVTIPTIQPVLKTDWQ